MRKALNPGSYIVVILILVALFSAISQIGFSRFVENAVEHPVATAVFSYTLSNLAPFTKVGPVVLPGVDFLDVASIFILIGLVSLLNKFKGWNKTLLTIALLFPSWLLWKGIVFLIYLYSARILGFSVSEAVNTLKGVTISNSSLAPILMILSFAALGSTYFKVKRR